MTSTADKHHKLATSDSTATTAAASYASAAGANQDTASKTPLIATGIDKSQPAPPPLSVVGPSTRSSSEHAHAPTVASSAPSNPPANAPGAPVIARGSSNHQNNINGASSSNTQSKNTGLTMATNGPTSFVNGNKPLAPSKPGGLQFGFGPDSSESPAMAANTAQAPATRQAVPEPTKSPSPIPSQAQPIPIASGHMSGGAANPNLGAPPAAAMTFGSMGRSESDVSPIAHFFLS